MITVETYNYSFGKKVSYTGYGSATCPYCGVDGDIGTGEHGNPDVSLCGCGKWFRYFSTGRTQRVRQSNYSLD